MMEILVHDSADALARLAGEWRALASEDPAATVFHLPEYAGVWWSELAGPRGVRIVEMRDGGRLAGLAPLSIEPDGALRFFGDLETSDYLGPISRPADREPVAEALVETAVGLSDWSVWEMHGLAEGSGWPEPLSRALKAAGFEADESQHDVCPRIELPATYDEYLAALPGKLRHEIKRKARRLERELGPYDVRLSTNDSIDRDLERFYELHRSSAGPKGKFLHEGMASFFNGLAASLHNFGRLRLAFLDVDGRSVAGIYGFAWHGTWGIYNSAYDHALRDQAPGMVLVAETIRLACEEGCTIYDFLRGSEEYKYRFGATDLALLQITVRSNGEVAGA